MSSFPTSLRTALFFLPILLLSIVSCRRDFDLRNRSSAFGAGNTPPKVRFDVTLDYAFLTAYNEKYKDITTVSTTTSGTIGTTATPQNDRVMSARFLCLYLRPTTPEMNGKFRIITVPIVDTFRPQALVRSAVYSFQMEDRGQSYQIEKAVLLDAMDSTILAAPRRNSTGMTKLRDSLVDSPYRLPLTFHIPTIDTSISVVELRMCFAGKEVNSLLPADSLGYTAQDFNTRILTAPSTMSTP